MKYNLRTLLVVLLAAFSVPILSEDKTEMELAKEAVEKAEKGEDISAKNIVDELTIEEYMSLKRERKLEDCESAGNCAYYVNTKKYGLVVCYQLPIPGVLTTIRCFDANDEAMLKLISRDE